MQSQYVFDLHQGQLPAHIGNKAENIRFLIKKGFRTPTTLVCTWDAYLCHLQHDPQIVNIVKSEVVKLDPHRAYAVRSSANIEDGIVHSFAGQFTSMLSVRGTDAIMQAIHSIWNSTQNASVGAYLDKSSIDPNSVKMAVIIQEMIQPSISGVAFSKNPMNGLDEIVVEAVRGTGDELMQGKITPGRWINKRGTWVLKESPDSIPEDVIQQVIQQTQTIAKAYGSPVDLEWVYDGKTIYWVQLRGITTLDHVNIYSNKLAKEMLPGMIKPLIWSVNTSIVNRAWVNMLTEIIGPNDIDPNSLAKTFYYRAYFNMGTLGRIFETMGFPRDSLEKMMGIEQSGPEPPRFKPSRRTLGHLPRLARFIADKWNFAPRVEAFLPGMKAQFRSFPVHQAGELDAQALLGEIEKLEALTQETAYYNVLTPLLMGMYNASLKGHLKKIGVDLTMVDLTKGMTELEHFDPRVPLAQLHEQYAGMHEDLKERIKCSSYAEFCQIPNIAALQEDVALFIERFGHLSDSGNDFSCVPWRENPDRILKMIVNYVPPETRSTDRLDFDGLRFPGHSRWMTNVFYQRVRKFRFLREAMSSLYTYGYGLLRIYFLALGNRLVERGNLESPEDIFYFYADEVKEIVKLNTRTSYADKTALRKREMEQYRDVTIPTVIYGDQPPPIETAIGNKLYGTPTSRGFYTGRAKVVRSMDDFEKVSPGDVLIVTHSDVGWTPLFAKAGAVVAECGGMLSHSSIVAREYNIPAVVSVNNACHLEDNTLVSVDGHTGEIIIHASN